LRSLAEPRPLVGKVFFRLYRTLLRRIATGGRGAAAAPLGEQGEELAYWHLRERGFTMVARNYRPLGGGGEVDLIGWDGGTLVFIEVKSRASEELRRAEDAVDEEKRRHLVAAARDYRRHARIADSPYRFDVVSVHVRPGEDPAVEHFRDAFREAVS